MHDQKQDRREEEEGLQRQLDVQEGQLYGIFQEQIDMPHRAGGDREVEHQEEIGEPKACPDAGRVLQRLLDRLEIMRLLGDGGFFRRAPRFSGWPEFCAGRGRGLRRGEASSNNAAPGKQYL